MPVADYRCVNMIYNNSLNFTSNKLSKLNDSEKEINKQNNSIKDNPQYDYLKEDHSFEGTAKAMRAEDIQVRKDFLTGALLALSIISAPFVYTAATENSDDIDLNHHSLVITKEDKDILAKADSLAKGGKRNDYLERQEFEKLLDYSALEGMSKSLRETIKINARSMFLPIDMNSPNAKEEILKQVKNAQHSINTVSEDLKKNPIKSYRQMYMEYAMNNITDKEILDNVDFSELEQYQYDMTMVRGLISMSRDEIRRNDADVAQKRQRAIDDAQAFVDGIVKKYKTRATVTGNYNGDEVLSKGELATLLNLECLNDLPEPVQYGIVAKVLQSYEPRDLRYATDKQQVKIENQKVEEDRKKSQELLDQWAAKAHKEFYHLTHPNELRVERRD